MLVPAKLELLDGVPYSPVYDDLYHSHAGGPAQAQHVFLKGNGLPERWAGRERFIILETGFGAGINFLTTLYHSQGVGLPVAQRRQQVRHLTLGKLDLHRWLELSAQNLPKSFGELRRTS